jgi:hypothetical protein
MIDIGEHAFLLFLLEIGLKLFQTAFVPLEGPTRNISSPA